MIDLSVQPVRRMASCWEKKKTEMPREGDGTSQRIKSGGTLSRARHRHEMGGHTASTGPEKRRGGRFFQLSHPNAGVSE